LFVRFDIYIQLLLYGTIGSSSSGLLYLFSLMHLSGYYRMIIPGLKRI